MAANNITIVGEKNIVEAVNQSNSESGQPKVAEYKEMSKPEGKVGKFSAIPDWARILAGVGAIAGLIKVLLDLI